MKSRVSEAEQATVDVIQLEGQCFCVVGECRSEDGIELRFTAQKITPMQEAISTSVSAVEWLISPYNSPEHFVKQLSQCIYNIAPGSTIRHKIKIQISDNSFIEFTNDGISTSTYNTEVFNKLMKEPAVIDMKCEVRPTPERENKYTQFNRFQKRN